MHTIFRRLGCVLALLVFTTGIAQGQALRGRVGLQMKGSSPQESVAPGLHLDAQLPVGGGVALSAGGGFSAYLLKGRTKGTYTFHPEGALRITLPSRSKGATTIFGGGGYHLPFGENPEGADPTAHLGVGRIWALRESVLFVDLAPTLLIREETVSVVMPLRAGIVF